MADDTTQNPIDDWAAFLNDDEEAEAAEVPFVPPEVWPTAEEFKARIPAIMKEHKSVSEGRKIIGVGRTKMYEYLKENRIAHFKVAGKIRIPLSSLIDFMVENFAPAVASEAKQC